MERVAEQLCRYFHAGQEIQIVSPHYSVYAEVLACAPGRVIARAEAPVPDIRRVLVRAPVKTAIFQASAQMAPTDPAERTFSLGTFSNMQCTERRAFARMDDPIPTRVFRHGDTGGFHRLAAVNLGANGLLLGWPSTPDVALGERVQLEIGLDDQSVEVAGEVVRVDGCRSAIRFLNVSSRDQQRIAAYIFRREVTA